MAEATTRIYLVKSTQSADADVTRLVRAANASQALRHVVESYFDVALASQDDCFAAAKAGVEVEDAKNGSEP